MKKVLMAAALVGVGVLIAGQGAWGKSSGTNTQKLADLYKIDQIEKTWHKAASRKNLDLMMTLWARKATFTIAGKTYIGKAAIRQVFAKAGPFQPQNHWESDTPAYKVRATVNGNKGTLYFECHYIDVDTGKVAIAVGADQDVRKINGKWVITKAIASSVTLKP
jgi:SnoaL-like domain